MKKDDHNLEIVELEIYFKSVVLPAGPVQLTSAETIIDLPLFIKNHLGYAKRHAGNSTFDPYLKRLMQLKRVLENV